MPIFNHFSGKVRYDPDHFQYSFRLYALYIEPFPPVYSPQYIRDTRQSKAHAWGGARSLCAEACVIALIDKKKGNTLWRVSCNKWSNKRGYSNGTSVCREQLLLLNRHRYSTRASYRAMTENFMKRRHVVPNIYGALSLWRICFWKHGRQFERLLVEQRCQTWYDCVFPASIK
jgi:hypothetical protein